MVIIVYPQIEKQLIMEELIELEKRNEDQLNDGTVYDSSHSENDEFQIMETNNGQDIIHVFILYLTGL